MEQEDAQAERDGLTERERHDKELAAVNQKRQERLGDVPAKEEESESQTESE